MEEQLVSWQTAKLLKEKSFNLPCYEFYLIATEKLYEDGDIFKKTNHNQYPDTVSAPRLSLVQKWFREIHKIDVISLPWKDHGDDPGDEHRYRPMIYNVRTFSEFKTYDEALEFGLKQAINLIK